MAWDPKLIFESYYDEDEDVYRRHLANTNEELAQAISTAPAVVQQICGSVIRGGWAAITPDLLRTSINSGFGLWGHWFEVLGDVLPKLEEFGYSVNKLAL